MDFLSTQNELRNLSDNIEDYFYNEGHTELLPGLMVINLNLRSVTASEQGRPSLLSQQVKKLTENSSNFLSTIQIGVTLAGFRAGAAPCAGHGGARPLLGPAKHDYIYI